MTLSIGAGTGNAEQRRQHESHKAVRDRLWGTLTTQDALAPRATLFRRSGDRPGANLPRDAEATIHAATRHVVDFKFAMELVCSDRQLTPDQMLNSTYCAAVAARHMLWTVLLDGGHSLTGIGQIFSADPSTVKLGIESFREFQKGDAQ